jgi:hypothetical protein
MAELIKPYLRKNLGKVALPLAGFFDRNYQKLKAKSPYICGNLTPHLDRNYHKLNPNAYRTFVIFILAEQEGAHGAADDNGDRWGQYRLDDDGLL